MVRPVNAGRLDRFRKPNENDLGFSETMVLGAAFPPERVSVKPLWLVPGGVGSETPGRSWALLVAKFQPDVRVPIPCLNAAKSRLKLSSGNSPFAPLTESLVTTTGVNDHIPILLPCASYWMSEAFASWLPVVSALRSLVVASLSGAMALRMLNWARLEPPGPPKNSPLKNP